MPEPIAVTRRSLGHRDDTVEFDKGFVQIEPGDQQRVRIKLVGPESMAEVEVPVRLARQVQTLLGITIETVDG